MDINDKFIGSIIGFVTGDALGVPVEFLSKNEMIRNPLKDMIEYGTHNQPMGTWSDDTSMVLATMDSIVEKKKIDYNDIMKRYTDWLKNAKYTATDSVFDVGITTRNAISRFVNNRVDATKCGDTNINQNGNGSLMRMIPIVCYLISNKHSDDEVNKIINSYSSMTHGHEISRLGCRIFYDYISLLFENNMDKNIALSMLKNNNYSSNYSQESINYYRRIIDGSIANESANNISGSGFVRDTLEAAIWATVNSNSYEEAVLKAINLGDDTDTVGAITGAINGVIYGKNGIPKKWIDKIKKIDYINELCFKFCDVLNNTKKVDVKHSSSYDYIMSQLMARRNELTFDFNMLDSLAEEERKKIEKLIVECILSLNNTSYKYMPYLKYEKVDINKVYSKLERISSRDRYSFIENYYCLTKDSSFYNYLRQMSVIDVDAFLSILNISKMFPDDLNIRDDISMVLNSKKDDVRYNLIYSIFDSIANNKKSKF